MPFIYSMETLQSVMSDPLLLISPIHLSEIHPQLLPSPKFCIGQQVLWAIVPTHGFGTIVGLIFARCTSIQATGFHYAICLDPVSPSSADCRADWAFEADLELLETHAHLLPSVDFTSSSR